MSVNIGWEGGVLVQTCGHYLHLDCHTSYVASLMVSWYCIASQLFKHSYFLPFYKGKQLIGLPVCFP